MKSPVVLIVEDNAAMRELLTNRLKTEDIEVRAAPDMATGLAELRTGDINLLLLDLLLGPEAGKSGADLVRQARLDNTTNINSLPIVVLSDWLDPAAVLGEVLSADQYDYFHKPSTSLDTIAQHIKQKLHGQTPAR